MTLGNDVSSLFPDVVKCMQTNSLDLKHLGDNGPELCPVRTIVLPCFRSEEIGLPVCDQLCQGMDALLNTRCDALLHLGQAQPDLAILAINAFRTD